MALNETTDKATFKKMLADVLSDTPVQAKDGKGNEEGNPHRLSLYLNRIRENKAHAADGGKHSGGDGEHPTHDHSTPAGRTGKAG